jgi:hypothetical protein
LTTPDGSAGATALNCVGESNVTGFAAVDPNFTAGAGAATVVEVIPDPQPLFDAPLAPSPP